MESNAGSSNQDLIWGLDHLAAKKLATHFIIKFENLMCVYSPNVKQLYTRYQMLMPLESSGSMVVFPDFQDITATYSHINPEAIVPTNVYIIPGEAINKPGLHIVIKPSGSNKTLTPLPLEQGLKKIQDILGENEPFLPVLVKGNLREIGKNVPALKLSRLKINSLSMCSKLEQNSIRGNITDKIKLIAQSMPQQNLVPAV